MKNYLFPNHYRRIGWCMVTVSLLLIVSYLVNSLVIGNDGDFIPGKALALINSGFGPDAYFTVVETDWSIQLIVLFFCVGSLFVGFSRERDEDEYIATIRFQALTQSLLVNTAFVVLTTFFVYGFTYIYIMYFYSFSILAIFIAIYYWKMYQFRKNNNEDGE